MCLVIHWNMLIKQYMDTKIKNFKRWNILINLIFSGIVKTRDCAQMISSLCINNFTMTYEVFEAASNI